ncbi:MAG: hypothetical protein IT428_27085 [Planctomycetaceae bacterium]|nr:hypothetical protein [Planctomycetaceae bacterium]
MLTIIAAVLGFGIGTTLTSEPGTKGRFAGLGLVAFGLLLSALTAAVRGPFPGGGLPNEWTPELGGWLIWSLVGLAGAAAAVFSSDIRLGVQGGSLAAIATTLLLVWADSSAAALAIVASTAALLTFSLTSPCTRRERIFDHPWLAAIGLGLLSFILLTTIPSSLPSLTAGRSKRSETRVEPFTTARLADGLLPAIVVVAFMTFRHPVLSSSASHPTDATEMDDVSDRREAKQD